MQRMMMREYFITICKKARHPSHHDRLADASDVEDLSKVRRTREIKAGAIYPLILWWFVNKNVNRQTGCETAAKTRRWFRLNPSLSCLWSDLAVYIPTVTQKHTRSFFISQDEIESQKTLMSHLVHTHARGHTHTQTIPSHSHITVILNILFARAWKNIMVFKSIMALTFGAAHSLHKIGAAKGQYSNCAPW